MMFEVEREKIREAQEVLDGRVGEACSGPHSPRQHRDGKPPWCPACGRDSMGVQRFSDDELPQLTGAPDPNNPHQRFGTKRGVVWQDEM